MARYRVQIEVEMSSRHRWSSKEALAKAFREDWSLQVGSNSMLEPTTDEYYPVTYKKFDVRVREA
jgi:hypothetical protein